MSLLWPSSYIQRVTDLLLDTGEQLTAEALLYEEKDGGFQCDTCQYVTERRSDRTGRCSIMIQDVHLDNGCCAHWEHDPNQLEEAEQG